MKKKKAKNVWGKLKKLAKQVKRTGPENKPTLSTTKLPEENTKRGRARLSKKVFADFSKLVLLSWDNDK